MTFILYRIIYTVVHRKVNPLFDIVKRATGAARKMLRTGIAGVGTLTPAMPLMFQQPFLAPQPTAITRERTIGPYHPTEPEHCKGLGPFNPAGVAVVHRRADMHIGHVIAREDIGRLRRQVSRRHDLACAIDNPVIP